MPSYEVRLTALPRVRLVAATDSTLSQFSCGGLTPYERDVDETVAELHRGMHPHLDLQIAEDPTTGELVGLSAVELVSRYGTPHSALTAINHPFRGSRLPDGGRIGDFLMAAKLQRIKEEWSPAPMPLVVSSILPANRPAVELAERHGFVDTSITDGPYALFMRAGDEAP
jgi:hypothetical protein